MAFGGVQTNFTPGEASGFAPISHIGGVTLAPRVGAPDITAADTGQFTTAVPVVNQNGMAANFGRGRGNWIAGDELHVEVIGPVCDPNSTSEVDTSSVHFVSKAVVGGNLQVTLHNKGVVATGALDITIKFD